MNAPSLHDDEQVELAVVSLHVPPVMALDVKSQVMGMPLFYRAESLLCAAMFLRLYLIWRW